MCFLHRVELALADLLLLLLRIVRFLSVVGVVGFFFGSTGGVDNRSICNCKCQSPCCARFLPKRNVKRYSILFVDSRFQEKQWWFESYPNHTRIIPESHQKTSISHHLPILSFKVACVGSGSSMPPKKSDGDEKAAEKHCRNRLAQVLREIRSKLGSDAVVRCIQRSVTKEELGSLRSHVDDKAMSHFAQEVAARSQGHQDLEVMVCGAAQSSIGGRRKAQRLLSAPCRKKLWGKVRKHIVKQQKGRKSKVHSPTIQEKVNSFLLQNATVTGKLMKCQGAVLPVYNLKSSRGRLWARSPAMQSLLSRPVWYKHLRAHHANFVRLKCRTDVCTFCHKYDKVLLPALRKDLASARGEVESVDAKYFESFDKHWESMKAQNRTDPDDCLSLQHVKFFKLFLDKTSDERSQKATPLGTVAFRQRLKEAEAKASHMMANYLDVLESCSHHFQTVHRQQSAPGVSRRPTEQGQHFGAVRLHGKYVMAARPRRSSGLVLGYFKRDNDNAWLLCVSLERTSPLQRELSLCVTNPEP